jgi:hypothetical protein
VDCLGGESILAGKSTSGALDGLGTNAAFDNPTGLALSSTGYIIVADQYNNLIRLISPAGKCL